MALTITYTLDLDEEAAVRGVCAAQGRDPEKDVVQVLRDTLVGWKVQHRELLAAHLSEMTPKERAAVDDALAAVARRRVERVERARREQERREAEEAARARRPSTRRTRPRPRAR